MDERIIKYHEGKLSRQEQESLLEETRENPGLRAEMIKHQQLLGLLELLPEKMDLRSGHGGYSRFKRIMTNRKRKAWLISFGRYAAIVALAFTSAWILAYYHFPEEGSPRQESIAGRQELTVPPGQRAELTLPDGTKVWLNAGSKLSYPSVFSGERRVFLSGEGFFEVAKNERCPFVVSTRTIDIKAIGTRFNVFSYPDGDYTGVYLQEGKVKAYFPSGEEQGVMLQPTQYLVQKGREMELSAKDPDELLWREGIYTFKKQRLGDIIKKLELYYDVRIIITDQEIANYEYIGKFRQRDGVMEILHVIQRIHPFKIKRNEAENLITLSK